jgi:hypothetical protein
LSPAARGSVLSLFGTGVGPAPGLVGVMQVVFWAK